MVEHGDHVTHVGIAREVGGTACAAGMTALVERHQAPTGTQLRCHCRPLQRVASQAVQHHDGRLTNTRVEDVQPNIVGVDHVG